MQHGEIVAAVQERAGVPDPVEADRVTRATLDVLGRRLTACPNRRVAFQLPSVLASELHEDDEAADFGIAEFYERVAGRSGTTTEQARQLSRVVVDVVRESMRPDDVTAVLEARPVDFGDLLGVPETRR